MTSRFRHLARGLNRKRGEMNRTEAAYAAVLDGMKASGEVVAYWFEPASFRLSSPPEGQPARVTPDFMVLMASGEVWVVDCKTSSGFDDNAGIVRLKCGAESFPLFRWFVARQRLKRDGGGFELTEL